jgi:hypothetical protein
LKSDDLLLKIRLLTLASLGSQKSSISFDVIAKELHINDDEIDLWVLEGARNGYIEGKIDELERMFVVRFVLNFIFSFIFYLFIYFFFFVSTFVFYHHIFYYE